MHHRLLIFAAFLMLFAASCKPTRYVQEGQHLVLKNTVHFNENELHDSEVTADNLEAVVKQKPNRRFLGIVPLYLGIWNFANEKNQDRKLYRYLKNDVGEPPVIFEEGMFKRSEDQIYRYLENHGYFDAKVSSYVVKDEKTVEQVFYVFTGPGYKLRKLGYSFEDDSLRLEFTDKRNQELTKLKLPKGTVFNTDKLKKERDRLTNAIKNQGYFTFEKIHVLFDIDTNIQGEYYDIMVRFRNQRLRQKVNGQDTIIEKPHLRHKIDRIYVNLNYEARSNLALQDTIRYRDKRFIYVGDRPFLRPTRLNRNIFIDSNDIYSLAKTQYTYDRLNALNNFRFIDIGYKPKPAEDGYPQLDMLINLTKAPRQAITLETTGTNRSGNLGFSVGTNYKNKNLFRGAEQFDWRVYGGVEWQNTNTNLEQEGNIVVENTPINTYEFGTMISLTIPDFLFRNPNRDLPRIKEPKTSISVTLDRQGRPQYDRDLINTSFQWNMRFREQDQFTYAPVDISVIELNKTDAFEEQLQRTRNALLINSYDDHIIAAGRASYSYTTQDFSNSMKNYYLYRINVETAGNMLRGAAALAGLPKEGNSYLIDSIAFAQYVKADVEFVKYFILTPESKSVFRIFAGSGLPLANREALPFDRSYFAGGSNGIRAWPARALGPGNLADTATYGIDQVGELQLELNMEYRFKLVQQLEGALFADFGNIWIWNDPDRPAANFDPMNFWRAIAIAPGAGVRLNLGFFVIRFDGGVQLKDPNLPQGERWAFQPKTLTNAYRAEWRANHEDEAFEDWTKPNVTFNLAISYPF